MRVFSFFFDDQCPRPIEVEYHARFQIPAFHVLGLPAPEIQEARERIIAAFQAAALEFPKKKIMVNLAPSSIKKSGTGHDLAIAIKIFSETQDLAWPERILAWGELGLDGSIKPAGRMAALIELLLKTPDRERPERLILAPLDAKKIRFLLHWREKQKMPRLEGIELCTVNHLKFLSEAVSPRPLFLLPDEPLGDDALPELTQLLPLALATERLLKISLVGRHHVLLLGPKGVGKSESLHWFKALSPPSTAAQTWQRLLHAESRDLPLTFETPIRQVHAQVKPAHLLGSYSNRGYQAGELALAHGGLFVADEFMEWPRDAKESLREPLQNKRVMLTRVRGSIETHCDFQFIATGNLCPCGGLPPPFRAHDSQKRHTCRCRASEVEAYLHKLSGPILDRIDLTFILTDTQTSKDLPKPDALRAEIVKARTFALAHFGCVPSLLSVAWLEKNQPSGETFDKLLRDLPSLRARHKVMRVARSIQALESCDELKEVHLFEAKTYRLPELT